MAAWLAAGSLAAGVGASCSSVPAPATSSASTTSTPASSAPTATAAPSPTATPTPTSLSAPQGIAACPPATPLDQHALGTPGGPGSGQRTMAAVDLCGGGSATIPAGTARFITGANWGLGIADSCPVGSSGEAGMNAVITITEVLPGGGQGPDTATEAGDWTDSGAVLMATGGNFQLQVTTVSPGCVWHVVVYPT